MSVSHDDVLDAMRAELQPGARNPFGDVATVIHEHVEQRHARNQPSDLNPALHLVACLYEHQSKSPAFGHERFGEWNSELWAFCRLAKAYPAWSDLNAASALREVETLMLAWPSSDRDGRMGRDRRVGERWLEWLSMDDEDARVEFIDNWDKVRYVPGKDPIDNALARADLEPLELESDRLTFDTEGYRRFLSMAAWLQVVVGGDNIRLPVRLVAEKLDVNPKTANAYCNAAMTDGFMVMAAEAKFIANGRSRAREYLFDVARWPRLLEVGKG